MIDQAITVPPAMTGGACSPTCPACRQRVPRTPAAENRALLIDRQTVERLALYLGCSVAELRRSLQRLLADDPEHAPKEHSDDDG